MSRIVVALPLLAACRTQVEDAAPGVELMEQMACEVEGGFRGELGATSDADALALAGRDLIVVVSLLSVRGDHASLDVSIRPGMGRWMVGTGTSEMIEPGYGTIAATVGDGHSINCVVEGEFSQAEGLVDADLGCWNTAGETATYAVTAGRF